jgi:hypothetical protein
VNALDEDEGSVFTHREMNNERLNDNGADLHPQAGQPIGCFPGLSGSALEPLNDPSKRGCHRLASSCFGSLALEPQ